MVNRLRKLKGRPASSRVVLAVSRFVIEYGRMCAERGFEIPIETYSVYVHISRAQGFRRQQTFRELFPETDVLDLYQVLQEFLDESPVYKADLETQALYVSSLIRHASLQQRRAS